MIEPKNIGWGSYKEYEGPFFRGTKVYVMPNNPSEADKALQVLTATEGGRYDAVNMYDRCIVSVGLIQWCEASQYSTSDLLGAVADKLGHDNVIKCLKPALDLCNATFKKNSKGKWRFFFLDKRNEVDTLAKQRELFLGCNGLNGSWDPASKERALLWAACLANVWQDEEACRIQVHFTHVRLRWFYTADAKKILLEDAEPNISWAGALRAAFNSFAGNLPTVAGKHLRIATDRLKSPKWSPDWCVGVLQELTFGPNIAIYLHRYDVIRPYLERLWAIQLPKTSAELKTWVEPTHATVTVTQEPPVPVVNVEPPIVNTTVSSESDKPPASGPIIALEPPPIPDRNAGFWVAIMNFLKWMFALFAPKT